MIPISRPNIGREEKEAVMKVLDSGIIASGPKVKEFEKNFAEYCGVKHAVAVSNGTCAIHAALHGCGIKKGDRVITTPFTFIATSNSIIHAGGVPVFADVEGESFNISPEKIEELLKKDIFRKIKAVIPVHLYGQVCQMEKILQIAEKYGVKVIEDAAQAHGAKYNGKKAGSFGDAATFSMYATKNMATGEGGMVTTNDDSVAEKIRVFINHGMPKAYYHTEVGYNYRTTDIEAAIGVEQLKKLDGFNAKRKENAHRMFKILASYPYIKCPQEMPGRLHIYHQFTVRIADGLRDKFVEHLNAKGIGAKIFYPIPLHKQPVYAESFGKKSYPVAEKLASEVLSLPVHPLLTDADFVEIEEAFKTFDGVKK